SDDVVEVEARKEDEHHHDHEHDHDHEHCIDPTHNHHDHDHKHEHHDHTHEPGVSLVSIVCERTLGLEKANFWLGTLLMDRSEDIYRMKGLLSINGMDERFGSLPSDYFMYHLNLTHYYVHELGYMVEEYMTYFKAYRIGRGTLMNQE
ncbi:COBW domain-containing protein 1-like protein isoform X2, partial [Tanacetum coccineum]